MTKHDQTFDKASWYGSTLWAATTLGRSVDWMRQHRDTLTTAGFPTPDPITGQYLKADVEAWINARRRVADRTIVGGSESPDANMEDIDYGQL